MRPLKQCLQQNRVATKPEWNLEYYLTILPVINAIGNFVDALVKVKINKDTTLQIVGIESEQELEGDFITWSEATKLYTEGNLSSSVMESILKTVNKEL